MESRAAPSTQTPEGAAIIDLVLAIFLANGRVIRAGDALLHDLGLTGTRWQVLCAVTNAPKTVSQIARQYELTRQGILWIVRGMISDGIVELVDNPDHKRAKLVALTDEGRALLVEVEERRRRWSEQIGAQCVLEELRSTVACLESVSRIVRDPVEDEG